MAGDRCASRENRGGSVNNRRVAYSASESTALEVARDILRRQRDRYQEQVDRLDEALEALEHEISREKVGVE